MVNKKAQKKARRFNTLRLFEALQIQQAITNTARWTLRVRMNKLRAVVAMPMRRETVPEWGLAYADLKLISLTGDERDHFPH